MFVTNKINHTTTNKIVGTPKIDKQRGIYLTRSMIGNDHLNKEVAQIREKRIKTGLEMKIFG